MYLLNIVEYMLTYFLILATPSGSPGLTSSVGSSSAVIYPTITSTLAISVPSYSCVPGFSTSLLTIPRSTVAGSTIPAVVTKGSTIAGTVIVGTTFAGTIVTILPVLVKDL